MASPAYELSTDANGNTVLVPAATPVSKPRGFLGDVASKAREYFSPRVSDFTEGTAAAYGAGKDISQRGYENFKTNPLYGAGQVLGGSALSAISPLAGATEYLTKPVGRTLGPAPEHAAEVASMFAPLPSKGASMFKFRPKASAVEFANIPKEWSVMPDQWKEYVNALPANQRQEIFRTLNEASISPAEAVVLENKYPSFTNAPSSSNVAAPAVAAPSAASEAVQTARTISPVDLAIQQNRNPGRFVNPETGMPQSVRDPLTGQARPAMGAVHDPFAGLIRGVEESPATAYRYINEPRPVINPDTGYQLRNMEQGASWGTPRAEWTPGQHAARAGVVGAPALATALALTGRDGIPDIPSSYVGDAGFTLPPKPAIPAGYVGNAEFTLPPRPAAQQAVETARTRAAPAPMPPSRELQAQARADQPSPSILSRIFSGEDYQSKGGQLRQDGRINWGDPESAADFFRASKALQQTPEASGMKRGGAANAKPDSVHKALEIIHHLLTRSH
jgi:hypothetical protein